MASEEEEPYLSAEDAIFATDLIMNDMAPTGVVGKLSLEEMQKFAEHLFGEEGGIPDDLKEFFRLADKEE